MNGQEWATSVDGRLRIVLQPPVRGVTDMWAVNAYERDGRLKNGKAAIFDNEQDARNFANDLWNPDRCIGGKCLDIYTMCSRHGHAYQMRYGRASNE